MLTGHRSMKGEIGSTFNQRGFSLIELIIVIAIVAVLAAIAIPAFRVYQATSKQAEAKVSLGAIFTAAVAYEAESQNPSSYAPTTVDDIRWFPVGETRYSFWYGAGVNAMGNSTTVAAFRGSSTATAPCNVSVVPNSGSFAVAATSTGFTAGASGNIDGDSTCDAWFINDLRTISNPINDAFH